MNDVLDDQTLLQRYAETASEEAFAELVRRHVHHVYSVARRETSSPQQAEEITQAAFIILARKARRLSSGVILSAWLFQTARYAARNARRAEQRRQRHEQEIVSMSLPPASDTDAAWEQIEPFLNDGLAALGQSDRETILLRFFEKKTHAEIAAALRTNEASARKRLSRAIERLKNLLARRGVSVPTAVLLGVMTTHSVQAAPSLLIASATNAAVSGAGASALVTATLNLMAWSKLKFALATAVAVVLAGTAAVMLPDRAISASGPSSLRRTLSDGSVLTITHMELASQATLRYQSTPAGWQQTARRILPYPLNQHFGNSPSSGNLTLTTTDGLESFFIGTSHEQRPQNSALDLGRLQVEGDDGSTFDGVFSAGTMVFNHEAFQGWRLPAFPRRGTNLLLRFFYPDPRGRWTEAAQIRVPNPAPGSFPTWTAEALPTVRTNQDLVARLVAFEAGPVHPSTASDLSSFWRKLPGTRFGLDLQTAGGAPAPWTIRSIQISDATGNRWIESELTTWVEPGSHPRLAISMRGALWASESAWDIEMELSRTNGFSPDELVTFSNLSLPGPEEMFALGESQQTNGVTVELAALAGSKAELPSSYQWMRHAGKVNLAVATPESMKHKRLTLVRVSDEQGRPVPFVDRRNSLLKTHQVFGLQPGVGASTISVTFAAHDSRHVTFRARPQQGSREGTF